MAVTGIVKLRMGGNAALLSHQHVLLCVEIKRSMVLKPATMGTRRQAMAAMRLARSRMAGLASPLPMAAQHVRHLAEIVFWPVLRNAMTETILMTTDAPPTVK